MTIAVGGKLIGTAHWRAGRKTALLHQHAMKVDQTLLVGMMASTRASPGGGPGGPVAISAIAVARLLRHESLTLNLAGGHVWPRRSQAASCSGSLQHDGWRGHDGRRDSGGLRASLWQAGSAVGRLASRPCLKSASGGAPSGELTRQRDVVGMPVNT